MLTEAYENGEVAPEKCEDPENFADPQTKYLTFKTWARHLHYTHNFKGDAPPRAEKKKKTAAALVLSSPNAPRAGHAMGPISRLTSPKSRSALRT